MLPIISCGTDPVRSTWLTVPVEATADWIAEPSAAVARDGQLVGAVGQLVAGIVLAVPGELMRALTRFAGADIDHLARWRRSR